MPFPFIDGSDTDEKLDKTEPHRSEPPPIDNDDDPVAPATDHSYRRGDVKGGYRPLKGGYWFIFPRSYISYY